MASIDAQLTAIDVSETIRQGKSVNLGKIIRKRYAVSTSLKPKLVTSTKSYQNAITPLAKSLEEERLAIMERLKVTRNKAKYRDLMDGLDKVTKTIQLLTGGATENIAIKPLATLDQLQNE